MIGYVPPAQTGLALLADNEDDRAVGRKLMEKLGPKPFAMPDEEFSEAVLLWPLTRKSNCDPGRELFSLPPPPLPLSVHTLY